MNRYSTWMVTAAVAGLAVMTGSAQWTTQLLNNFAVTDEDSGDMVILHDGGGAWG